LGAGLPGSFFEEVPDRYKAKIFYKVKGEIESSVENISKIKNA